MAHLVTLEPTTTIQNVAGQTISAGENLFVYDTVLYDPSHSADLVNGGVKVTTSGLYVFSFGFSPSIGGVSTGEMDLNPTCQGAGDFKPTVQKTITVSDLDVHMTFVWVGYLYVPAPDILSMYSNYGFDNSQIFQPIQMSVQRIG